MVKLVKLGKQKGLKSVKGIDVPNNMEGKLPIVQTDINQPYTWAITLVLFGLLNLALTAVFAEIVLHISLMSLTSITDCLY